MPSAPELFLALEGIARRQGAEIDVSLRVGNEATGELVTTLGEGQPALLIRVRVREGIGCPRDLDDVITLAHEMGHLRRRLDGLEDEGYARIADIEGADVCRQSPQALRRAALVEEEEAWAFARAYLEGLGVDEWTAFEAMRAKCLQTYVENLQPDEPDI